MDYIRNGALEMTERIANSNHRWVLGPNYIRCLDCKAIIFNPSTQTLLEIGAVRIEDGLVKFTLDKDVEKDLRPEIKIVSG